MKYSHKFVNTRDVKNLIFIMHCHAPNYHDKISLRELGTFALFEFPVTGGNLFIRMKSSLLEMLVRF